MFITIKRIIKSGVKTFLRNSMLSASSIIVMTITMIIILFVFFTAILMKHSIKEVEKKVDVNIYFKPDVSSERILEFRRVLENLPQVDLEKTNFISREQVLENFKKKHKDNEIILEGLGIVDENPLGAVLNIKSKDISGYSQISEFIESKENKEKFSSIINNLNYNENKRAIEKLNLLVDYTYKIGSIASLILIIISIIVTFNTMRLIIYTFKEEISVMRLVGASKFFARGPFMIEGMIYGIISAVFALFIFWTSIYYTSPYISKIFNFDLNQFVSQNILYIFGSLLLGGILLGMISTYLSVSKYLKI